MIYIAYIYNFGYETWTWNWWKYNQDWFAFIRCQIVMSDTEEVVEEEVQ